MLIYACSRIDEPHVYRQRETKKLATKVNKFMLKMSLLGMIDTLGGGLVSPLLAYWFFLRYGVELKSLGFMFFLSYFLAAMSFLTAPIKYPQTKVNTAPLSEAVVTTKPTVMVE